MKTNTDSTWTKTDGTMTRDDGATIRKHTVHEADRMTGGRCSHTGWRRVWVAYDSDGVPFRDYPGMVCSGTIGGAIENLERIERKAAKEATARSGLFTWKRHTDPSVHFTAVTADGDLIRVSKHHTGNGWRAQRGPRGSDKWITIVEQVPGAYDAQQECERELLPAPFKPGARVRYTAAARADRVGFEGVGIVQDHSDCHGAKVFWPDRRSSTIEVWTLGDTGVQRLEAVPLTTEQRQAFRIAARCFALCFALNAMDDRYADGHGGPFAAARDCAVKTLTIAFDQDTARAIADRVWDTSEHSDADLERHMEAAAAD